MNPSRNNIENMKDPSGNPKELPARKRFAVWISSIAALLVILVIICLFSLFIDPSFRELSLLQYGGSLMNDTIMFDIRLPRIILGIAVGGALSISGVMLQGIFRNSLVEPYTLGISGGAAVGVCINIFLRLSGTLGPYSLPAFGFIGALCVVLLLDALNSKRGNISIQNLLLMGVMVSFISSSIVMLILSISHTEEMHGIVFWMMGSLEETDWFLVKIVTFISVAGLIVSCGFCHNLNAMILGEEEAIHLGVHIERTKKILFLIASILTGISVSVAGVIGFVGLIVPHFIRIITGIDHRTLIPASFIAGGIFLVFCDTIGKMVAFPSELPVGVVTGITGGILFVWLLARRTTYKR